MFKFIVKRTLLGILILFFAMFIIYALMVSLPSGYAEKTARELATRPGNTKSAQQWLDELNQQLGMDKGIVQGYFNWLGQTLTGHFGDSWMNTKPVTQVFHDTIWVSFSMNIVVYLLQICIAIPLGVLAARKQYSFTDYSITFIALVGISLPTFFVGTLFKLLFAVKLPWLDLNGMTSRNYLQLSPFMQKLDIAKHLILPCLTLTIVGIGDLMRYTRANTLEVLNADYIRTARAKGLSENRVINYHAFRNTLIPLVTILGSMLPGLFSGAMITEQIFDIRGIGYAGYTCMVGGDIPFTMFYLSFSCILILLGNLIADILYAVVDPRVRVN